MTDAADACLQRALELIGKSGMLRSPALAEQLGISKVGVESLLQAPAGAGLVVTCEIEAGGERAIEYRLSASRMVTKNPHVLLFPQQHAALKAADKPARIFRGLREFNEVAVAPLPIPVAAQPKEEAPVSTVLDKLKEALRLNDAPMKLAALAKAAGVEVKNASPIVSVEAKKGTFVKLAHGVYGLPGMKLQEKAEQRPVRKAGGKPTVRRKRRLKAKKQKRAAAVQRSSFRPALAADGAILLFGARKGDHEITREAARNLVEITRLLNDREMGMLVKFVGDLDGGKVGA